MLDLINQIGLDPQILTGVIAISAVLFILAYRRFMFSIFDPLCMFVLTMVADSTLTLSLPWATNLKIEFIAFLLFLWAGFAWRERSRSRARSRERPVFLTGQSLFELRVILSALFVIIIAANLYLGVSTGFPLLSLHPGEAKVDFMTGGMGLVRRINMGPYVFFCGGCMLLVVIDHKRTFALTMLCVATLFVALGGSKGVLLPLVYAPGFLLAHRRLKKDQRLRKRATKYLLLLLAVGLGIALLVTSKDVGSISGGVSGLGMRFLLAGDVILYYLPRREEIMSLVDPNLWGYFHFLLGDLFGMLRISDYQAALGSIILGSDSGFGPNAQYLVQADLFFGPTLGLVYSFILGYVIASFRRSFFDRPTRSAVRFAFRLFLALSAFDLAIDSSMFVVDIATAFLVATPCWIVARLIWTSYATPLTQQAAA